jgi:hypothetical protein
MRCSEDLTPEIVSEIASILAAGCLKYHRSLRVSDPDNCLDSSATLRAK